MADAAPEKITGMHWVGRIISGLIVALLLFSGVMKFNMKGEMAKDFEEKMGWKTEYAVYLGIVEIACALIYAVPQTAVIGAILVTGYLGGATATHARIGDIKYIAPVVIGMVAWLGLYLRDYRIRAIVPWRAKPDA